MTAPKRRTAAAPASKTRSGKQATRSKAMELIERNRMVLAYHKAGLSMREIGQKVGGISRQRVHVIISNFREELIGEMYKDALDTRATITARLDEMLQVCYEEARNGNLQAVDRVLRIEAQRAKLWGADVVHESSVEVSGETNSDSDGKPSIVVKFRMGGQEK